MLSEEEEKELLDFLNKNKDVFAWSAGDLRVVSRDIVEHHLDIRSGTKPEKFPQYSKMFYPLI